MTISQVNKELRKIHPNLKFRRGQDVYYLTSDDPDTRNRLSTAPETCVYVPAANLLTLEQWIEEAEDIWGSTIEVEGHDDFSIKVKK